MKRKKRRYKLRPAAVIFIFLFAFLLIFVSAKVVYPKAKNYISTFNTKTVEKLNLKTKKVPDYVTVELISKGNARPGTKMKHINDIVVHYTGNPGTTAQNNRDYFAKPDTQVCSHFVIGLEGEIIQCIPLDERSVASNHRNKDTVSIEVCHPDENGKFTEESYDSLVKLTAWLLRNCDLTEKNVIRHYDVTGKECPKYYVNHKTAWKKLRKDIKKELSAIKSE